MTVATVENWRRPLRSVLVGAVLVPMTLLVAFMCSAHVWQLSVPWYGNVLSQTICTLCGVGTLIYHYRWRGFWVSLLYGPLMFGFLLLFTLFLGALVYGDVI